MPPRSPLACGSKSDANEENFGAAVSQYLEKHGALCLTLLQWPTDIPVDKIELSKIMKRDSPAKSMDALVAAGVVSMSDADVEQLRYDGKPSGRTYRVKRYTVSEIGRKYYRKRPTSAVADSPARTEGDLCFGKMALDRVVKWDLPMKVGDLQQAGVTYTYKIGQSRRMGPEPGSPGSISGAAGHYSRGGQAAEDAWVDAHQSRLGSQGSVTATGTGFWHSRSNVLG